MHVPVLSSEGAGKTIDFFAEYWLPAYPDHPMKSGKISIQVTGKDQTPPQMSWINIKDDNILRVKLYDGGEIARAEAILQHTEDREAEFQITLNDQGMDGDSMAGDQVFSKKIDVPKFGLYQISIEVTDVSGNKNTIQIPAPYVLYGAKLYHE
jgi:hypothetical protein